MLHRYVLRAVVVSTFVFMVVAFIQISGGKSRNGHGLRGFPQPQVRQSAHGTLQTTLQAAIARNLVQDPTTGETRAIETPTYEGSIPGPTLRLQPGDTLDMLLVNDLPPNPLQQRMGGFPHDPSTTNLHTHGLTVSPQGNADNVLREMVPGTVNPVQIKIPDDHQTGTFWYHPHKHGSVSYQLFGGMAGMLIVEGGPGTLDYVPAVKAAREVVMVLQVIRTDANGQVPFVNPDAQQLGSDPDKANGLWSTYLNSHFYFTTNGVTNPTLQMRPGEVQRWRVLNAASGETLVVALQGHSLHIIANDGITIPEMQTLGLEVPYVMGVGQRVDFLVRAGAPGTYLLQTLDPAAPQGWSVVSGSGIDPAPRNARMSGDFPSPTYPVTLATIVVAGKPRDMPLPTGPLPVPQTLPSIDTMLGTPPDAVRNLAFENCGQRQSMAPLTSRLPTCGWYFERYDASFWGGTAFTTLNMMRDDADQGVPNPSDPAQPLVDFQKEALFDEDQSLFDDMIVGHFEEWTVVNRSFSDHIFHIHQNPFLLTHVNGQRLPVPEWHDTLILPAAQPQPGNDPQDINQATFGAMTFRTRFDPDTVGSFVMHCHILTHEDIGMMQRLTILPADTAGARQPRAPRAPRAHH
jgi:FtsP/CotA-like multicopper oxidase with cupredoxin domain